jgi:hypothetical protein
LAPAEKETATTTRGTSRRDKFLPVELPGEIQRRKSASGGFRGEHDQTSKKPVLPTARTGFYYSNRALALAATSWGELPKRGAF